MRPAPPGRTPRQEPSHIARPPTLTPPRQRVLTIPSPVHGDSKRALQAGSKTAPSVTCCPASTQNTQQAIMFIRIPARDLICPPATGTPWRLYLPHHDNKP